jgi:hypothetical protein
MARAKPTPSLYERDFCHWTAEQAAALRGAAARRLNLALDFENLAEEIESLGRSDRRALVSHIKRVIEHLLKLQYSPAHEPRPGWQESVDLHRQEARELLNDSPSLRHHLEGELGPCYRDAARLAVRGLASDAVDVTLPETCPYPLEDILSEDWWPGRP